MGLLVSVALVLRASPAAAILLSDALVTAGARYSGPQRLPYLLWMLAQAAMCAAPFHLCHAVLL